jgi:pimeloyl-ACP methyl ester carboxylesterase
VIPETHYVKTVDGVHIAYQVLGSGPLDLVFVPGFVTNLEAVWQWPVSAAYLRRLATFSRVLIFDRRGTGLSDHLVQGEHQLTVEARVDDLRAVMDDASSRSGVLFGAQDGTAVCAMFGATYPDRVIGLVAYASSARGLWAADYPWAWSDEDWAEYLERVDRGWGTYAFAEEETRITWPDLGADPDWINRYARWMRMAAGPGDAAAIERTARDLDIRDILPRIQAPTLLIHRTGDEIEPVEQSRYMAERIPGARLVELPGRNHGWAEPNQDEVLDVVAQFLTELRREEAEFDRVLATVLFTDIVGSTEPPLRLETQGGRSSSSTTTSGSEAS